MKRRSEGASVWSVLFLVFSLAACETKKAPASEAQKEAEAHERSADEPAAVAAGDAHQSDRASEGESKVAAPPPALGPAAKLEAGVSVWNGTIGSAPVALTLRARGDKIGGRYFYKKHGRSLILAGTQKDGQISLEEQGGAPEKVFGEALSTLELRTDGRRLVGTWTAKSGMKKSLPVALEDEPKQSYDELRQVTRLGEKEAFGGAFKYESLRSIDEHLVYCKTEKAPPVDVSLIPGLKVLEDECHFAFEGDLGSRVIIESEGVQVTAAKPDLLKDDVNRKLAFTMAWEAGETWAGSHRTKVIYAGGSFLSVEFSTSGLGLGAYPDHDQVGKTLDLRTGKFLTWSDLLEASKFKEFRTALLGQVEKKLSEDCGWSELWAEDDTPELLVPYLTEKGLHVTPIFPHVQKACQYEAFGTLVSSKIVQSVAKKGGPLETPLPSK